jgi:prepilin-type N-terminal cleavage/methylation domain-containing protein
MSGIRILSRLRSRLRAQRGFTVVELVVAIAIGSVVMLVTMMLLDTSLKQSTKVAGRVDSTQRGRTAMERITRELRSQVCFIPPGGTVSQSVTAAGDYSITFFAFNGSSTGTSGVLRPDRRTLTWNTNTNAIEETIETPVGTPVTSFATGVTRTILTNVTPPAGANVPVFSYKRTNGTALGPGTLSSANAALIGQITIRYQTSTGVKGSAAPNTSFESQVFVRTADPNGLGGSTDPVCS